MMMRQRNPAFEITGGVTDRGTIAGNAYDKYNTHNPLARWLMRGFEAILNEFVLKSNPLDVHEVGCGEGYWVLRWKSMGLEARGSDFSERAITTARCNALRVGLDTSLFSVKNIYDLSPEQDAADLIVCCEVMEHLEHPEIALTVLKTVARRHAIISVPREPIWRILNIARGKYLRSLGNTPGHLQHWSRSDFIHIVGKYFTILEIRTPTPWIMLLCKNDEKTY